jgi:hypothetical protein
MPDDALFAEAAAGKLGTVAEVEAQARRMLADPKAKSTVESFQRQWLTVTKLPAVQKDPRAFPEFTEALRAAMAAEIARFANFVILESDGRLPTLLTAPVAFVNEPLAKIYGVDGVKGSALQRTATDPAQRFGVLTQAGVLATMANAYDPSLIARGKLVRERFLCQEVPAAPPDVPSPPPRPAGTTAREFFVQVHEKAEGCAGCHLLMDPIGFAFEGYDAIGRVRTTDNGRPIDARGEVRGLDGANRTFSSPRELVALLAGSDQVARCFAKEWARFGLRRAETAADAASLDHAFARFAASGQNVRELLVGLVVSPTFRYRAPSAGEVIQ